MDKPTQSSMYNYTRSVQRKIPLMEDDELKRESELLRQMHPLLISFLFTGLDFRPQCAHGCHTNVKYLETGIKIYLTIINIISWIYALVAIYGIIATEDSMPTKQCIANGFVEILTIFLRCVLYWRRKEILNNFKYLSYDYDKIKHKSKYLNKGVISVLVVILPGVHILSYGFVVLYYISKDQIFPMYFIRGKYGNIIPVTLPPYIYYLLVIIDILLFSIHYMSTCLFVILMLIACTTLSLILQDYRKSINFSGATFEVLQKRHIAEMNTVKRVDKCLSFPLFILLGFHITILFFCVVFFHSIPHTERDWLHSPSEMDLYFCGVFILFSTQYFVITTFAARVDEEVQNIKMEVAKMDGLPSRLSVAEQILLIAKVNSYSNICLTLWGFLNITKSFVFSSFGALLTFGALFKDL
ncbi:uncharacterized protein NPIL_462741 [Nephila pilipes]|uniref:Uncharacterized protein n=1 Tax=Nephila pilipes TaxID=299642 RepID=A0A8X6P100_NEPPI|nr:uncharacterized protein NPIL_462741 [Nephila pilipes]